MGKRPFEDIRVISLAWSGVGNFIAGWLGQYGATIVRVESAKRPDPIRLAPPYARTYPAGETPGLERSFYFSQGHSFPEMSMALDLGKPRAVDVFKKLVAWADVVIEAFTPGQMAKWGLGYEDLAKIKPDIIMFSTSGYGQTGPLAQFASFGQMTSATAGIYELAGWPDRPPVPLGGFYTDVLSPAYGGVALIAALDYRRRTGKGQHIDHCQSEATIYYLAPLVLDYSANGRLLERKGNEVAWAAPHGVYPCRGDDRWVAIAVSTDQQWESFCEAIGRPGWTADERFRTLGGRVAGSDDLDRLVGEWTRGFSPEQVMERMQARGVPAASVSDGKDLSEDPQLNANHYYVERDHPYLGTHRHYHPSTFTLSEASAEVTAPVLLGQHTEYVATKIIGLTDDEFVELLQERVFE